MCAVQLFSSAVAEKYPAVHASHPESVAAVPPRKPNPAPQFAFVWFLHFSLSFVDEYVPLRQSTHSASADVVAAANPFDVPQLVTVTASHGDVDEPGLNDVPATQVSQSESAVAVPAINP